MRSRLISLIAVLTVESYLVAAFTASQWETRLNAAFVPGEMILRSQPIGVGELGKGASQNIQREPGGYKAEYKFVNFNRDALSVKIKIDSESLDKTRGEYGYTQEELDKLLTEFHKNWDLVVRGAQKLHQTQAKLDSELAELEKDYKQKRADYLASKGFKLISNKQVEIDMTKLVHRNTPRLGKLAQVFENIGKSKNYDSEDLVGAVLSMVQTSIAYRIPPEIQGKRKISGLWPPLETLALGWGDCDTKTGVVASILGNWDQSKMIGLALPGHYLMGIYRNPGKGDVYIEHEGLRYVLLEPSGPGWMPIGTVGRETMDLLQAGDGISIDPFS